MPAFSSNCQQIPGRKCDEPMRVSRKCTRSGLAWIEAQSQGPLTKSKRICPGPTSTNPPISHRRRRHIRVGDSNRAGNVVRAIRSTRVPTQAPASEGGSIRYGDHPLFPLPLSHIHSLIHSSARWREIPLSNSETLRRLSEESGFEIPTRNVASKQTKFAFSRA